MFYLALGLGTAGVPAGFSSLRLGSMLLRLDDVLSACFVAGSSDALRRGMELWSCRTCIWVLRQRVGCAPVLSTQTRRSASSKRLILQDLCAAVKGITFMTSESEPGDEK